MYWKFKTCIGSADDCPLSSKFHTVWSIPISQNEAGQNRADIWCASEYLKLNLSDRLTALLRFSENKIFYL